MVVVEDSLFFQTAKVGTEGLAFDGGQFGSPRENLARGAMYSGWIFLYFSESSGRLSISR